MWRSIIVLTLALSAIAAAMLIPAPHAANQSPGRTAVPAPTESAGTGAGATPAPPVASPPTPIAPAVAPAAPDAMMVRRVLDIPGPIRFGTYYWDTKDVPADGQLIITVDIEAETMSVFRGGYEIGATAILYGMDDKPTPLGVHDIKQKKVHHISNLYHVPMPYMMRLTWDGIAIHAAEVSGGRATHGCIGVPLDFAKLLFAQAKLGDKVIITRGKRLDIGGTVTGG